MGLISLVGGGYPAHDKDTASNSSSQRHPYGTRAIDSSGGIYIYAKASTVSSSNGLVFLAPGADPWQATRHSSGANNGLSTVQGTRLAVQVSTANSTTQNVWVQVDGPATVLGDSSVGGAGVALFMSTTVAGAVSVTTTGLRIFGASIQSSGNSSYWTVQLGGLVVNQA